MKSIFSLVLIASFAVSVIYSLPSNKLTTPTDLSLDPAIAKLFHSIRDLEGIFQNLNELKNNERVILILENASKIIDQLQPYEIKALKELESLIIELNPTKLVKSKGYLLHSQNWNELIDFNQLLETSLQLLQSDKAIQSLFEKLESPIYATIYKRLISLPETKELLVGNFGISIESLSDTLENLLNWNLNSSFKITLYKSPLERFTSVLYPMMGCNNCPSCTACLPCCTLRKYMLKVPRV